MSGSIEVVRSEFFRIVLRMSQGGACWWVCGCRFGVGKIRKKSRWWDRKEGEFLSQLTIMILLMFLGSMYHTEVCEWLQLHCGQCTRSALAPEPPVKPAKTAWFWLLVKDELNCQKSSSRKRMISSCLCSQRILPTSNQCLCDSLWSLYRSDW